jgi:Ca2+-binding RTX toxin-like protein
MVNAGNGDDSLSVLSVPATTRAQLNGGGDDVFHMSQAGILTGIQLPVRLNGQAGSNWLDYSAVTGGVMVNLLTKTAPGVQTNFLVGIRNVIGGSGNDTLTGDGQANILVGGDGTDTFSGGAGNDILIGDAKEDTLRGDDGDDILIGGTTNYTANTANVDRASLKSIMNEWALSGDSYSTRIQKLTNSNSGRPLLTLRQTPADTVRDDAANQLFGDVDRDWFFGSNFSEFKDRVLVGPTAETANG